MAELKEAAKLFKQHKRLLTNSYHKLCRYIAERSVEPIESHRTHMIGLFKEFDELFDSVIEILVELQRDELMTPLLDYILRMKKLSICIICKCWRVLWQIWVGQYHQFGNRSKV